MRTPAVNGHKRRRADHVPWSQDVVVKAACQLAANRDISSVHVVTTERPTYADLMLYRQWANSRDLALTVDASSIAFQHLHPETMVVATKEQPPPLRDRVRERALWRVVTSDAHAEGVQSSVVLSRLTPALDWLNAHGRTWRAEFTAMSEGTR